MIYNLRTETTAQPTGRYEAVQIKDTPRGWVIMDPKGKALTNFSGKESRFSEKGATEAADDMNESRGL